MIESSRRGFITGLIAFAATAPAIVKASSLMPIKATKLLTLDDYVHLTEYYRSRTIRRYIAVEEIRDLNVLLRVDDYAGTKYPRGVWYGSQGPHG